MSKEYEFHEAANIFPMEMETIDELAEDIRKNGQYESIKIFEGKILDGRRRWTACRIAEVEPRVEEFSHSDPISYVLSTNVHRRNLSTTQRAAAAAKLMNFYQEEAKRRQSHGETAPGKTLPENLPEATKGDARDQAGAAMSVSGKTAEAAYKVMNEGIPELFEAMQNNIISVNKASKALKEPEEVQKKIASGIKEPRAEKKKKEETLEPEMQFQILNGVVYDGPTFAHMAIAQLERIAKEDPNRVAALTRVKEWIEKQLQEI